MKKVMDGQTFKETVIAGLGGLRSNIDAVNDLNVFPIPDGDTGENMGATLYGGVNAIAEDERQSVGEIANAFSRGAVLGARGNSGVILSQFFAGLADGIGDKEEIDAVGMGEAMREGVKRAYEAVVTPVEGTMLTVLREATEAAAKSGAETLEEFFGSFALAAKEWTDKTPDMLDVLKEAGVVDSGGMGVYYLALGMEKALRGERVDGGEITAKTAALDLDKFTENDVMEFGYCTELMLRLTKAKTNVDEFTVDELKTWLENNGDSVVIFKTGTIVKIHVHTFEPEKILAHCHGYGEFLTLKIENMTLQHNGKASAGEQTFKKKAVRSRFAIVAVANGEGMIKLFTELGAGAVIDGGQGKNPSTEVFLEAFEAVNADHIFVLPNNGNVIMAAEQAAKRFEGSGVTVIPSKSMGDGYSALTMLDYETDDPEVVAESMRENMNGAVTALVSRSVRDANLNGVDVKESDYIGFVGKTMLVSDPDKVTAAVKLVERADGDDKEFVTVFHGKDVTSDEKNELKRRLKERFGSIEVYETDGGQEVYDFMLVLE